ncbi:unnamed protein product [Malus baccata var. baccata]
MKHVEIDMQRCQRQREKVVSSSHLSLTHWFWPATWSRCRRVVSRLHNVERDSVEVVVSSRLPICRVPFKESLEASDRFNINSQLEHLQAKYVGTGHADMNRYEWAVNIQRDSYASYVGHYPMLAYFALAENESIGRERYNFMQKMLLPCGPPPEREDD